MKALFIKVIIVSFFIILPIYTIAQAGRVIQLMEKGKWEKAFASLQKTSSRDSANATNLYLLAYYHFHRGDSAAAPEVSLTFWRQGLHHFNASPEQQDKMKKLSIDSGAFAQLKSALDSAAFAAAKREGTVNGFQHFIDLFYDAAQVPKAIEFRNAAAFEEAQRANTSQAFADFIRNYPEALEALRAKDLYELRLFEEWTKEETLDSFTSFYTQNPTSPYQSLASEKIFVLSTANGDARALLDFINAYPDSPCTPKARMMLDYYLKEHPVDDLRSGNEASGDRSKYLVPVLQKGKFGFMDQEGAEVVAPRYEQIDEAYLCGNVEEEVLFLDNRLMSRSGDTMYEGAVDDVSELGRGFLKILADSCWQVMFMDGSHVTPCVENAVMLGERALGIKQDTGWTLWSLTGLQLTPETWDSIYYSNENYIFIREGDYFLYPHAFLSSPQRSQPIGPFDEVKSAMSGKIWVRVGATEGLYHDTGEVFVPLENHTVSSEFFGWSIKSEEGVQFINTQEEKSPSFSSAYIQAPFVHVAEAEQRRLYDPVAQSFLSGLFDSLHINGVFAWGFRNDSVTFLFKDGSPKTYKQQGNSYFLPGDEEEAFLIIEQEGKKAIFDRKGSKLFVTTADKIQYGGKNLFIIHQKEKKGLLNRSGKTLLPIIYDAIGVANGNYVSLLSSMKFGMFDAARKRILKPQYLKNIIPLTHEFLVAFEEGKYGIINWQNKVVVPFVFEEITAWNDSLIVGKEGASFSLWNLYHKKSEEKFDEFRFVRNTSQDKLAIVAKDKQYGVLHNRSGLVLPLRYSDIVNVGSEELPLWFTEKHVEEASLFVVIYYDADGRFLRREVYEPGEYERIYCPGN